MTEEHPATWLVVY